VAGKLAAQIAVLFVAFALALFLPAGTPAWPAGWAFLALYFAFVVWISVWLLRHDPGLLRERMSGFRPDQKAWDKVLLALVAPLFCGWLVLMPLDAVRFHWSRMPWWLQGAGGGILLCAFFLFYRVFRENPYLSPVVRVQRERGQAVVSTGPYAKVRHPLYSGFVLFVAGTALLLGSWWGLAFGAVLVAVIARRAVLEERALRAELEGYAAYMRRVRYRLIPHVW
jgi:protein-S-isoprenylcysteine O-methyltransferase Ste14